MWYLYNELVLFLQSRNRFCYVSENEIEGDMFLAEIKVLILMDTEWGITWSIVKKGINIKELPQTNYPIIEVMVYNMWYDNITKAQ